MRFYSMLALMVFAQSSRLLGASVDARTICMMMVACAFFVCETVEGRRGK